MKKSSFVAMVLGTVSGVLFALGMCMVLIPEWNAAKPGVVLGCVGVVLGIATLIIWRRMTGKAPVHLSPRAVLVVFVGIAGALLLGVGMCFCMVWNKLVPGIVIGLLGILLLFCLVPLTKGLKD